MMSTDVETSSANQAAAFRTQAGKIRAERNDQYDEYEVLQQVSCSCLDLASMENKIVADYYGCCSKEAHDLQILLENCHDREEWIAGWAKHTKEKEQGCRLIEGQKRSKRGYGKLCQLKGTCPNCNMELEKKISPSRPIAVYKLQPDEFWKAVVRQKDKPNRLIYEGSATCNLFGLPNHCLNPDHISLETKRHNTIRKRHHSGKTRCCCHKPCIGSKVRQCPDGGSAETKQILVTWHWEESLPEDLVPDNEQPIDEVQWDFWETTDNGPQLVSPILSSLPRRGPCMMSLSWNGGDTKHLTLEVKPSSAS